MIEIKDRNNEFWESARRLHLEGFLDSVYRDSRKRKLLLRWLRGRGMRRVVFRQMGLLSDPLIIEFYPDGFQVRIGDGDENLKADVEASATHRSVRPALAPDVPS